MGRSSGGKIVQLATLRMMATLHLAGHTQEEIAAVMGFASNSAVSRALNSPQGENILREISDQQVALIHDKVIQKIEDAQEEAFDTVIQVMRDAETDAIRLRAAESILDRAGHKKDSKDTSQNLVPTVNVNIGSSMPTHSVDVDGNPRAPSEGRMPLKVADGITPIVDALFEEVTPDGS